MDEDDEDDVEDDDDDSSQDEESSHGNNNGLTLPGNNRGITMNGKGGKLIFDRDSMVLGVGESVNKPLKKNKRKNKVNKHRTKDSKGSNVILVGSEDGDK